MDDTTTIRRPTDAAGIPADWPGSPLSTLHYGTPQGPPVHAESPAVPDAAGEGVGVMTIVVGVSGSPASALALRWAAAEASRLRAQLKVVLAWSIQPRANYAPAVSAEEYDQRHARAVAGLAATVSTVAGSVPPDAVSQTVVQGLPDRVLVEQSAGADLLVLGSAAGLVSGRPIGPVIRECLSHAHCPVVVVGPDGPSSHVRQGQGAEREDPAPDSGQRDLLLAGVPSRAASSGLHRRS
jgi:nucleotide-binding universal stress UspA family protein